MSEDYLFKDAIPPGLDEAELGAVYVEQLARSEEGRRLLEPRLVGVGVEEPASR